MNATATLDAAPAVRPGYDPDAARAPRAGYDPDAATTVRRVLPMLAEERVVWLSTVRPDGTPHLVPTWFLWDGEALLVWSKPNAVKVRNLRANPRLMVAVGDPHADFNVGLIEAAAELGGPETLTIPDAFFAKYRSNLAETGLDAAAFRATYTQAVRILPTRFVAWHGRGPGTVASPSAAANAGSDTARAWTPAAPRPPRLAAFVAAVLDRAAARLRGLGTETPATAALGA
jgi:PPOX class probable F420-dependent enzyme